MRLRPQMRAPEALRGVLRHGHLLEREAESVTDSLRALLLEAAGYRVKVFEFIYAFGASHGTMPPTYEWNAAVFVYGASDANGMYVDEHAVKPEDLAATIYHLLGIDPASVRKETN